MILQYYYSVTSRLKFWKRTPSKTPGSVKQVRGAQYPPIMNSNNPYKISGTIQSGPILYHHHHIITSPIILSQL